MNDLITYICPSGLLWNDGSTEPDKTITCTADGNWSTTITAQCKGVQMQLELAGLLPNYAAYSKKNLGDFLGITNLLKLLSITCTNFSRNFSGEGVSKIWGCGEVLFPGNNIIYVENLFHLGYPAKF